MEEIKNIFKKYEPIKSIYENASEYICIPKTDLEPLAVYYDKKLNQYNEVYFYQNNFIAGDIENSELICGNKLDFSDEL